jgi:hypothetical protein
MRGRMRNLVPWLFAQAITWDVYDQRMRPVSCNIACVVSRNMRFVGRNMRSVSRNIGCVVT